MRLPEQLRSHARNYYGDEGAQFETLPLRRSAEAFRIIILSFQRKKKRKEMLTRRWLNQRGITHHRGLTR